jgi:hypothetical protein
MLGFGAISTAAISALPDDFGELSIAFTASGTLAAVMTDPYADFVRNPTARRIYTIEFVHVSE